jgi:hypothetical protein
MHFHLPKPLHGWREFTGEVGIIVIGVLIALGAEQVVENVHWSSQLREARTALGYEIADSVGQGFEREHFYNCVEDRLDLLAATVDKAGETGRLPPLASPDAPPFRTWLDATWQTTMAGQSASRFSPRELDLYGSLYTFVQNLQQLGPREMTVWTRLDTVAGPGRAIEPAEVASLRSDISEARLLNRVMTLSAIRLRQTADAANVHYDQGVVRDYAKAPNSTFAICRPMDPKPPEHYGSAPLAGVLEHARKSKIILPEQR